MSSSSQPNSEEDDELETAVNQAISACGGDVRATIRALIVANEYLESEVGELMKAVSHAYARGRFNAYSGLTAAVRHGEAITRPLPPSIFAVRRVCYPRSRMSHCG